MAPFPLRVTQSFLHNNIVVVTFWHDSVRPCFPFRFAAEHSHECPLYSGVAELLLSNSRTCYNGALLTINQRLQEQPFVILWKQRSLSHFTSLHQPIRHRLHQYCLSKRLRPDLGTVCFTGFYFGARINRYGAKDRNSLFMSWPSETGVRIRCRSQPT